MLAAPLTRALAVGSRHVTAVCLPADASFLAGSADTATLPTRSPNFTG